MSYADMEPEMKPEPDRLKLEPDRLKLELQPLLEDGADDEDFKLEPSDRKVEGYKIYKISLVIMKYCFNCPVFLRRGGRGGGWA